MGIRFLTYRLWILPWKQKELNLLTSIGRNQNTSAASQSCKSHVGGCSPLSLSTRTNERFRCMKVPLPPTFQKPMSCERRGKDLAITRTVLFRNSRTNDYHVGCSCPAATQKDQRQTGRGKRSPGSRARRSFPT